MNKASQPFSLTYTPNIPELLYDLKFTLVLSTFQAGKLIFLSAIDREKIIQLPRTFDNAMGVAISDSKMAVACKSELVVLKNFPQLAKNYPAKKNTYDSLFLPRSTYNTGTVDLHDLNYVNNKLLAVNTLFSCLSEVNEEYSFEPIWKPSFITDLVPEDRCHLNGMVVENDEIKYVTALGKTNSHQGWRENKIGGGVIIHVPSDNIIHDGLSMPHSPRIYNDKLYFLNSALGELRICNTEKGTSEVIAKLGGFARGMARYGDFLFIGMSKLRHTTDVFRTLPIAKSSFAGVVVVYLPMGKIVGQLRYETSVDEIYDVKILPDIRRPGILNFEKVQEYQAVVTPSSSFWAMQKEEK